MVGNRLLKVKAFIPLMPSITKKIRIKTAVLLLSMAAPIWLGTETIAPQIVRAYTNRVDLEITRLPGDNYKSLLRRAEAVARAAAQRSFDKDILVTDVSVVVSAQNFGAIAPVLELNVSRTQWRNRPDTQRWAKYFKMARTLLFFGQSANNNTAAGGENNAVENTPQSTEAVPIPIPQVEIE
ncbi:hypothetical protein Riv7116_0634 [Rivularia sp. PCC 7116]|nr:hypothetical protein Riv7116_0634 [Rivularia sp. PCC 7116]